MCVDREREVERGKEKEMALETVVYPNDLFSSYVCKDLYSLGTSVGVGISNGGGTNWNNYDFAHLKEEEEDQSGSYEHEFDDFFGKNNVSYQDLLFNNQLVPPFNLVQNVSECHTNSSEGACCDETSILTEPPASNTTTSSTNSRRKRRRTRINKNKEEVENQRMTHIVVERNRRKQMNEYLAVLRSLMPASYVQRSDQASIIGGAINFVKELEQFLQSLEAQKQIKEESSDATPFADFFAYPQYSSSCNQSSNSSSSNVTKETMAENKSSIADIEVTMVETHANLKILTKKRPKQILKMVVGFQNLHLSVLHLNVTTVEQLVLYSFSVKVEEDCQLKSVDGIASAVHQMIQRIEEESAAAAAASASASALS